MEKESPSHTDTFFRGPLWEEHVIRHQVKVADGLNGVLSPQHVDAQLHAWHIIQTNDGPLKTKVGQAKEVIGSHRHLLLRDMKGVGSVPPPLKKALHQGSTHGLFLKKVNDGLIAHLPDIASCFGGEQFELLHYLIGASPTSIREW